MKDKIIEILALIPLDSRLRWAERWANHNKAADEITALMCYREVVGMFTAFKEVHSSLNYETVIAFIIRKLRPVYPEEIILAAIEQVKKEDKYER